MSSVRLSKATKELNISLDRAVEELAKNGHEIPNNRNTKITDEQYGVLKTAFADDLQRKKAAEEVSQQSKEEKETLRGSAEEVQAPTPVAEVPKEAPAPAPLEEAPEEEPKAEQKEEAPAKEEPAGGLKVMGKIDLDAQKPKKKAKPAADEAPAENKSHKPTTKGPKKAAGGAKLQEQAPTKKAEEKVEEAKPADAEIKTKYVKIDGF